MARNFGDMVSELMDTHITLWDIVDMLGGDDDDTLVKATRLDNKYNRRRSDIVEEIDEWVICNTECRV